MENLRRRVIYRQKQSSKGWRRYSVRMSTQRQYGESESKWYITSSKWGSNMYINAPETGRDSCEYYAYTDLNFINEVMLENANVNDLEMIQQLRHNPAKKNMWILLFLARRNNYRLKKNPKKCAERKKRTGIIIFTVLHVLKLYSTMRVTTLSFNGAACKSKRYWNHCKRFWSMYMAQSSIKKSNRLPHIIRNPLRTV